jgi:hypothetical protein
MKVLWLVLGFLLVGRNLTANVSLTIVQNVTVGTSSSSASVVVNTFDASGNTLAASIFTNYIRFFTQNSGVYGNPTDVAFTDTAIGQAEFSPAGTWIAVSGSSNNIYFLNPSGGVYTINQTFPQSKNIKSLAWANNGERLIVGLNDSSVVVLAYNRSNSQFYQSQTIVTVHT